MLQSLTRFFDWFSRNRLRAALVLFLLPIGVRLAVLPKHPVPLPNIADEFSYLLASDTFAAGRLANPTHPHWKFFEYLHVFHTPVYASIASGIRMEPECPGSGIDR